MGRTELDDGVPIRRLTRRGRRVPVWALAVGTSIGAVGLVVLTVLVARGAGVRTVLNPNTDGEYIRRHATWMSTRATGAKIQAVIDACHGVTPVNIVISEDGDWSPTTYEKGPSWMPWSDAKLQASLANPAALRKGQRYVFVRLRDISKEPLAYRESVEFIKQALLTDYQFGPFDPSPPPPSGW